jgi:hypothetical protein
MLRSRSLALFALPLSLVLGACGADGRSAGVQGPPDNQGPPGAPPGDPPTGQRWTPVGIDTGCGREGLAYVLVDEVCGASYSATYMNAFLAPMFRDGALAGNLMYAVDASHLWVLDVTDDNQVAREGLLTGIGQPVAMKQRGTELVIAAGDEGLVLVDVAEPYAPVRRASVALDGPALDVHVDGSKAYVATGDAGIAVIELDGAEPVLEKTLAVSGFAAGVLVEGGLAYVAACDDFSIVDVATGQLRGHTWLADAYQGEFLVAPAKDVELVGTTAFVAAGRFGAVSIDVSDPTGPVIEGNCTIEDDQAFYASGVRADGGSLFVAGGEWGVLPVSPALECKSFVAPTLPELPQEPEPGEEVDCTTEPPWKVQPWQDVWAPPPPAQDPIQVLPVNGKVYAFGDARRNGIRAVDVRDAASIGSLLGRYDEPRLYTQLVAKGDRVLALGKKGGVFVRDADALLVSDGSAPAEIVDGATGTFLDDGRWAFLTNDQRLVYEGGFAPASLPSDVSTQSLAPFGPGVAFARPSGVSTFDVDLGYDYELAAVTGVAEVPSVLAARSVDGVQTDLYVASPVTTRVQATLSGEVFEPHGLFDDSDVLDAALWRKAQPRHLLLETSRGLVEVASVGDTAGLVVHSASGLQKLTLPPALYVTVASEGDDLYLVTMDRGRYRSQLVTVKLGDAGPVLSVVESFTGIATGVAVSGDRLYVADSDTGIRVYARTALGTTLLDTVTP